MADSLLKGWLKSASICSGAMYKYKPDMHTQMSVFWADDSHANVCDMYFRDLHQLGKLGTICFTLASYGIYDLLALLSTLPGGPC